MSSLTKTQAFHKTFFADPDIDMLGHGPRHFRVVQDAFQKLMAFLFDEVAKLSVNTVKHAHRVVDRSRIALAVLETASIRSAAQRLRKSPGTVYSLMGRMLEIFKRNGCSDSFKVTDLFKDRERSGRPDKFSQEVITRVISTTTVEPNKIGHYTTFWTMTTLHEHINRVIDSEIADSDFIGPQQRSSISRSTISRIVKSANISPHARRYYLSRRDPDFDAKALKILEALQFVRFLNDGKNQEEREYTDYKNIDIKRRMASSKFSKVGSAAPYSLCKETESTTSVDTPTLGENDLSAPAILDAATEKKRHTAEKREATRKTNFNQKLALLMENWTWHKHYLELKEVTSEHEFSLKASGLAAMFELICTDEKPGVQLLGRVAPQLPMRPKKHKAIAEDHEYTRNGTADIFVAVNLSTPATIVEVTETHNGDDFNRWLRKLRETVPREKTILLICDNHSSHLTPENMAYLLDPANKFEAIHTPTHGSWLDPTESVNSVLAKQVLFLARIGSIEELRAAVTGWAERRLTVPIFSYSPKHYMRKMDERMKM